MTIALIVLPLLAAISDLIAALHKSGGQITLRAAIVPLILLGIALLAALLMFGASATTARRNRIRAGAAPADHEAIFQETGWRILSPDTEPTLRPWADITESRRGNRVLVLMRIDGFDAVPTSDLTEEQAGHLQRLLTRKVKSPA